MSNHQDRAQLFKQAVTYLADRGSEAAVLWVFGDPEPLNAAWELELTEFRGYLRTHIRKALKERGAA